MGQAHVRSGPVLGGLPGPTARHPSSCAQIFARASFFISLTRAGWLGCVGGGGGRARELANIRAAGPLGPRAVGCSRLSFSSEERGLGRALSQASSPEVESQSFSEKATCDGGPNGPWRFESFFKRDGLELCVDDACGTTRKENRQNIDKNVTYGGLYLLHLFFLTRALFFRP